MTKPVTSQNNYLLKSRSELRWQYIHEKRSEDEWRNSKVPYTHNMHTELYNVHHTHWLFTSDNDCLGKDDCFYFSLTMTLSYTNNTVYIYGC